MSSKTDNTRQTGPTRMLVRTATQLVPGPGTHYHSRVSQMLDIMCQYGWGGETVSREDRWAVYDAEFVYDNRRCYFLLDHGFAEENEEITTLWYQWDGKSL
jgi:hypothetical protein